MYGKGDEKGGNHVFYLQAQEYACGRKAANTERAVEKAGSKLLFSLL